MATNDDPTTWFPVGGDDTKKPAASSPKQQPTDDPTTWFPVGASDAAPGPLAKPPTWWSRIAGTASDVADYAGGIAGAVTHGLSFGLNNPLDRATAALFPSSAFAKLQQEREQKQKQFQQENPLAAGAAEIAGSLPTYLIGEGAARAAVPVIQRTGVVPAVANLAGAAIRNAAVSGVQGAGTTEGGLAERTEGALKGAGFGAVAGPVGEVAGAAIGPIVRGIGGTAGNISKAIADLGDLARTKYKIPVTGADLSNNQFLRTATDQSGKLPFSGAAAADAAKLEAWQRAIAKQFGEDATAFTPDVMDRAATRIGKVFDDVAKNTHIDAASTNTLVNDLAKIESDAHLSLPDNELSLITKQLENITNVAAKGQGTIDGASYQALTRKGAPLARAESSADPNVRYVAGQIRDALDDAFVRSASPADQAALLQARYQYRVMRTVDELAAGSRDGNISPDAFMQKVLKASRRFDSPTGGMAYTGGGDIGELARIGKLFRASPQTGTADRLAVNALALSPSGALGYLADPAFLAGMPATLALNRAANMYLRSNTLARNLIATGATPQPYAPSVIPGVASGYNALNPP